LNFLLFFLNDYYRRSVLSGWSARVVGGVLNLGLAINGSAEDWSTEHGAIVGGNQVVEASGKGAKLLGSLRRVSG